MQTLMPKTADNAYRGSLAALWLLAPVLIVKIMMGFNVAGLNPFVDNRYIIKTADGVPLDSFSAEAQELVMFLFSSWGLNLLLICIFAVIVLVRFRSLIPLAILWLATEQVGRKLLAGLTLNPDPSAAFSFGSLINWAFSILLVVAFVLSLVPRRGRTE